MEKKSLDKLIFELRNDIDNLTTGFIIMEMGEKLFGKINFAISFKDGKAEIIGLYNENKSVYQTFGIKKNGN